MNYKKMYKIYKKLPFINSIITCLLSLVWGIIDGTQWITGIGDNLEGAAIAIWLLIGAVLAVIVMFLTCVTISPVVVRTDAALEINNKINN